MQRVAFYTRISLSEEIQKYSLGAQQERLEAFCKSQYGDEWILSKVYKDSASGTNLNRPELQQMLANARSGAFDVILVFRVDRLSRRVAELSQLAHELKGYNVALRSATEPIDTSTPAGMMIFQTLGVFAEFEQQSIVQRTKTGMLRKAQTGSWPGGRVPLGYRFSKGSGLEIEETEAVIVRKVFNYYTAGKEGSSRISQRLNAAGYRSKKGRMFNRKSILHILRNPFYIGKFRWQQEEFDSDHQPIISNEVFTAAKEILEKRSSESPGKKWHTQDQRILSGLIWCRKCKSRMVGVSANSRGVKFQYYACTKRLDTSDCDMDYIRADYVEEQILSQVQTVFQDKALLESIWESAQEKLAENAPAIEKELTHLNQQRTKIQATIDRYYVAFETGTMTPTTCNQRLEDLTAQLKQMDDQGQALTEKRAALDLPALKMSFLEEILSNLKGVVDAVPIPQKKHLLHLLVKKVLINDRRTFEVWYRLPQFPGVRTLGSMVAPRGLEPLLPP